MSYLRGGTYVDGDLYVDGQIKVRGITTIEGEVNLTLADGERSVGSSELLRFNASGSGAVEKAGILITEDSTTDSILNLSLRASTTAIPGYETGYEKLMLNILSKNVQIESSVIKLNSSGRIWEFA